MTWITHIPYDESTGELRELYDRIKGPDDSVDNIMLAHSLRPHTMQGHMTLYKYVLHHPRNTLPKHYLETIGVYVSLLNRCEYCVDRRLREPAESLRVLRGASLYGSVTIARGRRACSGHPQGADRSRSGVGVFREGTCGA
jgi:alkylhydroperoxidase family enzyme